MAPTRCKAIMSVVVARLQASPRCFQATKGVLLIYSHRHITRDKGDGSVL